MGSLWKPDAETRSVLNRGSRKETIGWLKHAKQIIAVPCPECGSPVYYRAETGKYMTLGGSGHECVGLKKARKATVAWYVSNPV